MRRLRTHALGRVLWLDDGQLDAERLLLPLPDAKGKTVAWCLALPFLRPAEVTGAHLGDNYLRGIGQVHEWLIEAANAKRKKGQALIAISHAHMAGGSVSEDSERSLIIGNAEALPASLFGPSISYVALGHLHKPQKVSNLKSAFATAARRFRCRSPKSVISIRFSTSSSTAKPWSVSNRS